MNYTKLISKKKQYKYSVNICFDLHDEERLAGFIPNVTTTEILREYLGGIIRGNSETHSRILYGSYGTGKSHLLTVMSAILGHINVTGKGFCTFLNLVSKYDKELAADVQAYAKESKPYLIVPVYSDYDDFGKCITFSIKKELDRNGISVCFKGFYDEALELVNKWLAGEESSARLKEECAKVKINTQDLIKGLTTYKSSYEDIFKKVYAGMSYGAIFNSTAGNLIDNIKMTNDAIKDKYRGIVLIFDEFGRYVEDYGEELKVKSIQDLAEYCDHSDYDNYLILVSHKQLSLYTDTMRKNVSEEWKKIEGRFKSTSINIKYDQCLSLIGHIIPKTKRWNDFKTTYGKELNDLYNQAWDFKGFMLPPETEGENPFENGFPLHPITLFALDRLSKKVAQNERTFFTYLAGDDDQALFKQLVRYDTGEFHFIGLDAIYDYFEVNIKTFKTDESYVVYKKLQYALNKLGIDDEGYQTRVLKAIAAVNIISDADSLKADRETLFSVIDGNKEKVAFAVNELEKKKIIKFMRQYGQYDFFDSSIFDLEGMIEEKLSGINDEMVINTLNEEFTDFVLYPYSYNEKYHMNRVFIPIFTRKSELNKKSFFNALPSYYDGAIVFVMDDQATETDYMSLTELPQRTILMINNKAKVFEAEVKRYIAIQYFSSKKEELAKDDPTIVSELKLYLGEQEAIITELIRKWRLLSNNSTFVILDGVSLDISSEDELSNTLSKIMENAFDKTLIVNNDLLNKNSLSGTIRQARKKALEGIMSKGDIYANCGFLSPEYNILRATLSKNAIGNDGIVEEPKLNRFEDGTVSGLYVMDAIHEVLTQAEKEQLPLTVLYEALKREPFGLRDGYIPVLLAFALRDYENVSLYFHGNEHSYTEEELTKALEEHENYSLFICNWNEDESRYIEELENLFADYLPEGDKLNRLEDLFKAINSHYASISKSARTTEIYVSEIAKKYRNTLNVSCKDYNAFFFSVLPKLNDNLQELVIQISNIKNELESVNEKQYLRALRVVKQIFDLREDEDLLSYLKDLYNDSWKDKSQKAFEYTINAVLEVVAKSSELTERELISDLAKAVTGFELEYWSDNKINDFEEILRDAVNRLEDYNPEDGLQNGEMKITIETADGNPSISQFSQSELSTTAQTMLNKMKNTLGSFGESVSYEEKVNIMAQILKEIIN